MAKKKITISLFSEFRIFRTLALPSLVFQKLSTIHNGLIPKNDSIRFQSFEKKEKKITSPALKRWNARKIMRRSADGSISIQRTNSLETKTMDEFHANYNELYRRELAPFFSTFLFKFTTLVENSWKVRFQYSRGRLTDRTTC